MNSLIVTPPRTIMGVYKNLPEGTLAELIDNVIYMSPSPVTSHQKILQTIFRRLSEEIEDSQRGEVIVAPFDVYLDESRNAVQPDIVVILNTNKNKLIPTGHFHGVPDLVVEVLSPANKEHDMVKKKDLYEHVGVNEYWIVDPQTKMVFGYALKESRYVKIVEETGLIHSQLLNLNFSF
jgi:Uma2 family endonuclease